MKLHNHNEVGPINQPHVPAHKSAVDIQLPPEKDVHHQWRVTSSSYTNRIQECKRINTENMVSYKNNFSKENTNSQSKYI